MQIHGKIGLRVQGLTRKYIYVYREHVGTMSGNVERSSSLQALLRWEE